MALSGAAGQECRHAVAPDWLCQRRSWAGTLGGNGAMFAHDLQQVLRVKTGLALGLANPGSLIPRIHPHPRNPSQNIVISVRGSA
jgi:hypothetical protein